MKPEVPALPPHKSGGRVGTCNNCHRPDMPLARGKGMCYACRNYKKRTGKKRPAEGVPRGRKLAHRGVDGLTVGERVKKYKALYKEAKADLNKVSMASWKNIHVIVVIT